MGFMDCFVALLLAMTELDRATKCAITCLGASQQPPVIAENRRFVRDLKKKAAFTLAEVLITLGVIGIVAAMTLPMLIEDYRKKEIPIRMKKFYSTIESAIQLAVLDNGDMQYWTYPVEQNDAESTSAFVKTYIFPYLTGIKECDAGDNKCKQFSTILYGGNHGDRMPIYVFLDGSCFGLVAGDSGAAGSQLHITYDYNCMGKPNEFDKDIFAFYIKGKPYGEKQYQFIAGNFPVHFTYGRTAFLLFCRRLQYSVYYLLHSI